MPETPQEARTAPMPYGRYDSGERRRSKRTGRERGCWLYIPAEELAKAGVDLDGPPPLYRTWGRPRGSLVVRLYKDARPKAADKRGETRGT